MQRHFGSSTLCLRPILENNFPTHYLLKLISGDGDTSISKGVSSEAIHKKAQNTNTKSSQNVHNKLCTSNSLESNYMTVQRLIQSTERADREQKQEAVCTRCALNLYAVWFHYGPKWSSKVAQNGAQMVPEKYQLGTMSRCSSR